MPANADANGTILSTFTFRRAPRQAPAEPTMTAKRANITTLGEPRCVILAPTVFLLLGDKGHVSTVFGVENG